MHSPRLCAYLQSNKTKQVSSSAMLRPKATAYEGIFSWTVPLTPHPINCTRCQTMPVNTKRQCLAALQIFCAPPPNPHTYLSISFISKKPTDENNATPLFHVSSVSHVMPLQTMPNIPNTYQTFNRYQISTRHLVCAHAHYCVCSFTVEQQNRT